MIVSSSVTLTICSFLGLTLSQKPDPVMAQPKSAEIVVATKEPVAAPIVMAAPTELPVDSPAIEAQAEVFSELVVESEVSEWDRRLIANVDAYLNIRIEPDGNAEIVGKLYSGSVGDILESGEEWTKIRSGSVEGYVKNLYCAFGADAETMAKQNGDLLAVSTADNVCVRAINAVPEEGIVLASLNTEETLPVSFDVEAPDGWVAVSLSGTTAYVCDDYVTVTWDFTEAVSIAEEQEALRFAEEQNIQENAVKETAGSVQKEAVAAPYDDITLLGALIQCEAGSEPYEGKVAVGAVVMNRLRAGWANSISDVIYQNGQFAVVSNGWLSDRLSRGVDESCIAAAQEAINGRDNVDGALFFVTKSHNRSGQIIGNHVFFYEW